jgi:T5orf172 domain
MSQTAGEIYFIGEKDLRSREITPYFKVGIVRENPNNADRDSTQRLLEHQTGNPRELYIESVVKTDLVELVETLLHKKFAPFGVRGEWMKLTESELNQVKVEALALSKEAKGIITDLQKAAKLANEKSDEIIIPATDELVVLNMTYLEANAKLKASSEMFGVIKEVLSDALEAEDEDEDVQVFVQVQERKGRSIFDEESFKAKYGAIYSKFVVSKSVVKGTASYSGSRSFKKDFVDFDPTFAKMVDGFEPLVNKITAGKETKESLHAFSLELRRATAEAEWSKMKAESKIKVACGTHAGIEGVFKWVRTEKITQSLDKTSLKEAHPDLVAEFTTTGETVKAVIVDPKKGY